MVHAFVLVKTAPGASSGVTGALADVAAVAESHVVAGEYDLIIEVDGDEVDDVLSLVTGELQLLEGVLDTKTYMALE